MSMTARIAYRATFEEYARKLEALQDLMNPPPARRDRIEAALLDVEKARVAHSCARDVLAKELAGTGMPPATPVSEHHIRDTAQILWELAGRPEGTAECDLREAEELVHKAAAGAC
jgi:hypothetical protein